MRHPPHRGREKKASDDTLSVIAGTGPVLTSNALQDLAAPIPSDSDISGVAALTGPD
jgi:hypothetical protein